MSMRQVVSIGFVLSLQPAALLGQTPAPPAPPGPMSKPPTKVTVPGKVIDENGKPVEGATISGIVLWVSGNASSGGTTEQSRSNDHGEFTVELFHLGDSTYLIRAWKEGAFTARPLRVRGVPTQPLVLSISRKNARAVSGRLVDDQGVPISGAILEFEQAPSESTGFESFLGGLVKFRIPEIETGPDGRFNTPECCDPDGSYRLNVKAPGFVTTRSPWKSMPEQGSLDMGIVKLPRMRLIEGRVVDRAGKPIAGAQVIRADTRMRKTTVTDADGYFKLEMAFFPVGVLAAVKEGYRCNGQRCDKVEKVTITLTRRDQPSDQKMATLPPTLSREERKAIVGKLLEPEFQKALAGDNERDRRVALEWQATIDLPRVMQELEKKPIKDDWYDGYLRRDLAKRLVRDSFEEARAMVDSMRDPGFRSTGYLDLCDSLTADRRAEKINCLEQVLLHSKGITQNDHRVIYIGRAARRLLELEETARAAAVLREGQAVAKELPTAGWAAYARGVFAEDLGLIDLPAALELMKDLKDPYEFSRHHANLACKLASSRPEDAERVFKHLIEAENRQVPNQASDAPRLASSISQQNLIRFCYELAKVDLERARRWVQTANDPTYQAQAYGAIARALAKSKPKEALMMLDQAFGVLSSHADAGKDNFNNIYHGAAIAGLLIPVAAQIDPSLTAEFFWRAASLGVPPRHLAFHDDENQLAETIGATAIVLAPYDRQLTSDLVEQAASFHRDQYTRTNYIQAAAMVDPHRAVELIEKMPNPATHYDARKYAAGMILADGDRVLRRIHRALFIWHPDDIDE